MVGVYNVKSKFEVGCFAFGSTLTGTFSPTFYTLQVYVVAFLP